MALAPVTKKATISADIFGSVLTINFRDGRSFEVDVNKLTPEMQKQAMLHGMKQKLVDAAAIARSLDTGRTASLDDKYAAVKEVFDRVVSSATPTWNKDRASGDAKAGVNNIFLRALMQMTGKDRAYVDAFLESKSKEERAALKKNARVLAIMAELQAASAPSNLDTDNLLAELGADASEAAAESVEPVAEAGDTPVDADEPKATTPKAKRQSRKAVATAE